MILVLIFLKNIIIIYEIKRNAGGNYAKRCIKGEESYNSYNRRIGYKTLWNIIFKEESPEWKKWDAPYFRSQCKNTLPIREDANSFARRTTVKFNYRK